MNNIAQPLVLANEAFGEQKSWRRNQELIDALPYIDSLEPAEKQAVMAVIEEEAKLSDRKPADYLRDLPRLPESSVSNGSLVHSELLRVARGTPLAALDLVRYSLNKPDASKLGDLRAWQAALDNAHSQLQHQDNRLLNLELLLKYGPNAWRAQNEALSSHLAHLQAQLTSTRKAVDALNQERKLQQTAAGKELGALEAEYISLVSKNQELEAECNALEAEVSKMENEGD